MFKVHSPTWEGLAAAIPTIADWATLLAFAIAVSGFVAAVLSRPRVKHHVASGCDFASISFSQEGESPARNTGHTWGVYESSGSGGHGDGGPLMHTFLRGLSFTVNFDREGQVSYGDDPNPERELRITIPVAADLFYYEFSYQHPLLPWRRRSLRFLGEVEGQPGWTESAVTVRRARRREKWPPT